MSEEKEKKKEATDAMRRVEIIFSQAVEEDIFEGLKSRKLADTTAKFLPLLARALATQNLAMRFGRS